MTWTIRYCDRVGQKFEVVVDAKTKHEAFAIAQRHGVTPFQVVPGGRMPKDGKIELRPYLPGKVTMAEHKPWWRRIFPWLLKRTA